MMLRTRKLYPLAVLLASSGILWADPVQYSITLTNAFHGAGGIVGSGVFVIDSDVNVTEGGSPGFVELISLTVTVGNKIFDLNNTVPLSIINESSYQFPSAALAPNIAAGPEPNYIAVVRALWGPVAPVGDITSDYSQAGPALEITSNSYGDHAFDFGTNAYITELGRGCNCFYGFEPAPDSTVYEGTYVTTLIPEPRALSLVSLPLPFLLIWSRSRRFRWG